MAQTKYNVTQTFEQLQADLNKIEAMPEAQSVSQAVTDAGNAVKFTAQELTEEQKEQARENIGAGTGGGAFESITYAELKALRDGGLLVEGKQYRITDYHTHTSQGGTQSADNQFDIIVTADSPNTLNENARACLHEGDTYFSNGGAKLEAWELKYCLDNDTSRFEWAVILYLSPVTHNKCILIDDGTTWIYVRQSQLDNENGFAWAFATTDSATLREYSESDTENLDLTDLIYTPSEDVYIGEEVVAAGEPATIVDTSREGTGVIYYMKDEWDNECPYDFKNIQFVRDAEWLESNDRWTISLFDEFPEGDVYFYTFSWVNENNGVDDLSIVGNNFGSAGEYGGIYSNKIGECSTFYKYHYDYPPPASESFTYSLPNNIFVSSPRGDFAGCNGNILVRNCWDNSFACGCCDNKLEEQCYNNIFYSFCCCNTLNRLCYENVLFGSSIYNTFGDYCHNNELGTGNSYNVFGKFCYSNVLDEECENNIFGNMCYSNHLNSYGYNNRFGNNCYENTLGQVCSNVSFGNGCQNNTLGSYSSYNDFGNSCFSNKLGSESGNNTFGDGSGANTLGNYSSGNVFGNDCNHIKFGNSSTTKHYYHGITIDAGTRYIYLYCSATLSYSKMYRYVHLASGVNTKTTWMTITDTNAGQTFETEYRAGNISVDLTVSMSPNVLYNFGTLSGDSVFNFVAQPNDGLECEWMFQFTTPSTAPTITWPAAITSWFGGVAPIISANKTYQVSVLNGLAVIAEF